MKASGYGRIHGVLGLREFAQPRARHVRPLGQLRAHTFPYNRRPLMAALRAAVRWLRPGR